MTDTSLTTAETPSGKGPNDENFPVGSIFLPASLRPHVAIFYAYARAIDDVADNPLLTPSEKVQRLYDKNSILFFVLEVIIVTATQEREANIKNRLPEL